MSAVFDKVINSSFKTSKQSNYLRCLHRITEDKYATILVQLIKERKGKMMKNSCCKEATTLRITKTTLSQSDKNHQALELLPQSR